MVLCPVLLHRGCRILVRIRESLCKSSKCEGKRQKGAKAEKWIRKRTAKSMLQPFKTGVELAISHTPNAKFGGMLAIVELPKGDQLTDLGITFLDFDAL
jgi:hypothetical protein